MTKLQDKVVLVTGASRGIGKAIAEKMGQEGAIVIGTATSDGGADNISVYLSEAGVKGTGMCLNVTDADSIKSVLKAITDEFGAVNILVNNAGITRDNLLMMMKDDQ
ncbi:MAG: SDR family NAD(P)-dependent oxidoreductase, partial [Gammaproteobacteria bacterium]|nr:SDR family NAD(P)-dependent oxidoreductase [Gammaproteobacteria bacterium]